MLNNPRGKVAWCTEVKFPLSYNYMQVSYMINWCVT